MVAMTGSSFTSANRGIVAEVHFGQIFNAQSMGLSISRPCIDSVREIVLNDLRPMGDCLVAFFYIYKTITCNELVAAKAFFHSFHWEN